MCICMSYIHVCRDKSNRKKSTHDHDDRKTDSPSYDTVEMKKKDESRRCAGHCEFDEVITQNAQTN